MATRMPQNNCFNKRNKACAYFARAFDIRTFVRDAHASGMVMATARSPECL